MLSIVAMILPRSQVRGMMWFFYGDKTRLCQFSTLESGEPFAPRKTGDLQTNHLESIQSLIIPFPVHVTIYTASLHPEHNYGTSYTGKGKTGQTIKQLKPPHPQK